jgi:cell division protein FtsN
MHVLAQLQHENEHQRMLFFDLANRIEQMRNKIGQYRERNQRLKVVTDFDNRASDEKAPLQAVGGSEPTSSPSEEKNREKDIPKENEVPERTAISVGAPTGDGASSGRLKGRKTKTVGAAHKITASKENNLESYPYSLQLGSFRTLERAESAVSEYSTKGLCAYQVKADLGDRGIWYRVFLGYFKNPQEAEKFRNEQGLTTSFLKETRYANLIGIYSEEEAFRDEIRLLKELGYSPYLIKDDNGGIRLFTGAFLTKTGAEKQHLELQSNDFRSKIVKR